MAELKRSGAGFSNRAFFATAISGQRNVPTLLFPPSNKSYANPESAECCSAMNIACHPDVNDYLEFVCRRSVKATSASICPVIVVFFDHKTNDNINEKCCANGKFQLEKDFRSP